MVKMTQELARKQFDLFKVTKERDFYSRAFKDTHDQNKALADELASLRKEINNNTKARQLL